MGEEVTITGPDLDLHSGMYGGVSMNPARVLSKVIASLHDDTGRITVPGFYDGVPELPDDIQAQWQGLAFDHDSFLGDVGLSKPAGEQDRMPIEMKVPYHQPHLVNFFESIRGNQTLNCPGEIGYETAVMVLKVNEAIAAGRKIELKPEDFKV